MLSQFQVRFLPEKSFQSNQRKEKCMPEKLVEILHPRDSKSELRPHSLFETVPDPLQSKISFTPTVSEANVSSSGP